MNTTDCILLFTVIIAVIQSVVSLECYVCNSAKDPDCGDELFANNKEHLLECRVGDNVCMKQTTQHYIREDGRQKPGLILTTRFCGENTWTGCKSSQGAKTMQDQCGCNTPRCNNAPPTTAAASSLLGALLMAGAVMVNTIWH